MGKSTPAFLGGAEVRTVRFGNNKWPVARLPFCASVVWYRGFIALVVQSRVGLRFKGGLLVVACLCVRRAHAQVQLRSQILVPRALLWLSQDNSDAMATAKDDFARVTVRWPDLITCCSSLVWSDNAVPAVGVVSCRVIPLCHEHT